MQVLAAVFYGVGGCGREVRAGCNCTMVCVLLINADGWDAPIVVITMAF